MPVSEPNCVLCHFGHKWPLWPWPTALPTWLFLGIQWKLMQMKIIHLCLIQPKRTFLSKVIAFDFVVVVKFTWLKWHFIPPNLLIPEILGLERKGKQFLKWHGTMNKMGWWPNWYMKVCIIRIGLALWTSEVIQNCVLWRCKPAQNYNNYHTCRSLSQWNHFLSPPT